MRDKNNIKIKREKKKWGAKRKERKINTEGHEREKIIVEKDERERERKI